MMPLKSTEGRLRKIEGRPFRKFGTPDPERRQNFETENQRRLAILAGQQCPNCGNAVYFDGKRLFCSNPRDCAYGWSNAESAEDEIFCGIT